MDAIIGGVHNVESSASPLEEIMQWESWLLFLFSLSSLLVLCIKKIVKIDLVLWNRA